MSFLVAIAIALSLLVGGGAGIAYAADGAVPGDLLYGLDTAVESVRLALASNDEAKANLALEFAAERLEELQQLFEAGAPEGPFQLALDGYRAQLELAIRSLAQVMAGEDAQQGAALALTLQTRLETQAMLLNQLLNRATEQTRTRLEETLQIMETTRLQIREMEGREEPSGPQEPGGEGEPAWQGGESGGQTGPGGEPTGGPSGPGDGTPSEGQGTPEGGVGPGGFEDGMAQVEFTLQQMEVMAVQGDWQQVMNLAREYSAWVDELALAVNEAAQGNPESAQTMAAFLEAELENHVPRLSSLLFGAPDDAQTLLNQAITAAQNGMTVMKGLMGQWGPGGEGGEPGGNQGGDGGNGPGK